MTGSENDVLYKHISKALQFGRLTPFLGAGVNASGNNGGEAFQRGTRLPSSAELAAAIADDWDYPSTEDLDLVRVAQWVYQSIGHAELYDSMHSIFDHDFPANPVHEVIAAMPAVVRALPKPDFPLIITTNYDDALERAFTARGEPFDLLTYVASGDDMGLFQHTDETGNSELIMEPANKYPGVKLTERSAIVKLHGAVKRKSTRPAFDDSYVITEDDYIECLTRTDIVGFLPPAVARRMQGCHYLFLGYSLRDWNTRAMFHRIWRDRAKHHKSWAIVSNPEEQEVEAWKMRFVDMRDLDLSTFASRLQSQLASARDREAAT